MPAFPVVYTFGHLANIMPGCDGQAQQYLILKQRDHIHVRLRQYAVKIFLVVIHLIETRLIAQHQSHLVFYCVIKRTEATLAAQLTMTMKTDIQHRSSLMIHAALQDIIQNALLASQRFLQTRQLGKRNLTAYSPAMTRKIQTIDERSFIHEPCILYFLRHSVKIRKQMAPPMMAHTASIPKEMP